MTTEETTTKWKEEYKALQRKLKAADELIDFFNQNYVSGILCPVLKDRVTVYINQRPRLNRIDYPPTTDIMLKIDRVRGAAREFINQYTDLCELHGMVLTGCSCVKPVVGYEGEQKLSHRESLYKTINVTPIKFD